MSQYRSSSAGMESEGHRSKVNVIHCVSKNDSDLVCYNSDVHQPILLIFDRRIAEGASYQTCCLFSTSPFDIFSQQHLCQNYQNRFDARRSCNISVVFLRRSVDYFCQRKFASSRAVLTFAQSSW